MVFFEIGTIFAGHIGAALFGGSALAGFAVFRVLFGLAGTYIINDEQNDGKLGIS